MYSQTSLRNVQNNSTPLFYQEIVKGLARVEVQQKIPERRDLILEEFIFLNQLVNINANVLCDLDWIPKRVLKVKHVWACRQKVLLKLLETW